MLTWKREPYHLQHWKLVQVQGPQVSSASSPECGREWGDNSAESYTNVMIYKDVVEDQSHEALWWVTQGLGGAVMVT